MSNTTTETVTTTTTTTEIKWRDDLVQASAALKPQFTANAEAGTLVLPADAFFKDAGDLVTPQTYEAVHKHMDLFTNGATHAATELATEMFKAHPKLETITVSAPVHGKDGYEAVLKRHGTSRNPSNGEVTPYSGSVAVSRINVVSTRTKAEANAIKTNFKALAEAAGL